jgi:hypothetical protein
MHAADSNRASPEPKRARARIELLEGGALVLLYAALFAGWDLAGGSFHVWTDLWQLLPWQPLLEDLPGTLLDLHAQPPLLNLLFGVSLRLAVRFGVTAEVILEPVYFAVGALTVLVWSRLALRLVPRPWIRRVLLVTLVANPYLYASLHYLFYTGWELLFLGLSALLALRAFDAATPGRLAAALGPPALLVYTRSLFHPLWFVLLVAILLAAGRPRVRPASIAVAAVALALVAAWPLKNAVRFGFFGLSSWSGMSIARGVPTGEPLLPTGYQARLAAFARLASDPMDPLAAADAERRVPPEFRDRPAVAMLTKSDGSTNWNHYAIIPISRELGQAGLATLRAEPWLLLAKAADFYLNGYAIYEARWPYETGLSPEMTVGSGWASAYEVLAFQRFRPYVPGGERITTGFALLFPVILIAAAWTLWRRRGRWRPEEWTVALALLTILWVLGLVLFVDGPEGNRVRFSTEPYFVLVVGWLLSRPRVLKGPPPEGR